MANIPIPEYISEFMGEDFRSIRGVDVSFNLKDYNKTGFKNPVERRSGCYVISATRKKYSYPIPGSKSPVIYIGLSDNLYRRLHDEHFMKHLKLLIDNPDYGIKDDNGCYLRRITQMPNEYRYMLYNGAHVDVFYCTGNQDVKEFEAELIGSFYSTYGAMPVGNGARSFSQK